MSVCLRVTSIKPSGCLLCSFFSSSQIPCATVSRRPVSTQVALAHGRNVQPASTGASSSSITLTDSSGLDITIRDARKTSRKALKEAQEAERRRKALAILDKTTKFMAAGLNDSHEPTLTDLNRWKPEEPPSIPLDFIYPPTSTPSYRKSPTPSRVELYNAAFEKLVHILTSKFRRKQLLRLYKEGMQNEMATVPGKRRRIGSLKTSQDTAREIIRWLWHWPYISEVKERVSYLTSRSEREFIMSTSEFFLLLGRDGSSLLALTDSFGVVIKRVKRTKEAFALVVEGLSYKLDRLALVLTERRQQITSETIRMESSCDPSKDTATTHSRGSHIPSDLIQRISKRTDALVEDMGDDTFRISSHHTKNISMAKRLVARTSHKGKLPHSLLLAHLPPLGDSAPQPLFPHNYALFPYELSHPESLPFHWTPTRALTRSPHPVTDNYRDYDTSSTDVSHVISYLYRARKVNDWLEHRRDSVTGRASSLREGTGRLIDSRGEPQTLRRVLGLPEFDSLGMGDLQQVDVTASFGHIVFAPATGIVKTLLPPLRGSWTFNKLLDWMKTHVGRVAFIPELPNALINGSPSSQTVLSRLVYRSSTSTMAEQDKATSTTFPPFAPTTLKFEISIPQSTSEGENVEPTTKHEEALLEVNSNIRSMYDEQKESATEPSNNVSSELDPTLSFLSQPSSEDLSRLWKGTETTVNVMLPDRPMDIQLSSFSSIPIPRESEPSELREYAQKLVYSLKHADISSRPVPPLYVNYEHTQYVLDTNATIRSSSHSVVDFSAPEQLNVRSENAVDFESNQHSSTCFAICSEPNITRAWDSFLGDCGRLTWLRSTKESELSVAYSDQDGDALDPEDILH
ncbi:hypothetical protein K439DRAFT_1401264 [Ramaria rubella]|nr:hypothetical protein K439DRAFT_1401264 [Ramaria rubella]